MSTCFEENFLVRLRKEFSRLGLSQAAAARMMDGDTAYPSLRDVCNGRKRATAEFIYQLASAGVDILYILTGEHGSTLSSDERELLARFRAAPLAVKSAALGALHGGSQSQSQKNVTASGFGSIAAGRKIIVKGRKNVSTSK